MHFGTAPGRRLFGAYHAPTAGTAKRTGVVVCAPFGHEYIRAHRALRQLAVRLADAGYHVLRFDYFGCGDSDGEGDAATLDQWLLDIETAADELKETAHLTRVCLVGLRLGATMAAAVTARRDDVETLILWDPVVDGAAYLRELRGLQRQWLRGRPGSHWFARRREPDELIGFPISQPLRSGLQGLAWRQGAFDAGRQVVVADPGHDWNVPEQVHIALLRPAMVQRVAAAVEERVP